jgi:hypothetical protein
LNNYIQESCISNLQILFCNQIISYKMKAVGGEDPMKRKVPRLLAIILLMAISACSLSHNSPVVLAGGGSRTWFDAPLDDSILKLEPYPVVIHAYDPGGVSQVELSANGVVLENLKPVSNGDLGLFKYSWDPKIPGNYVLRARAKGQAESWNSESTVTVTVGEFTATLAPSFTPTITITGTTPTKTPTPVSSSKLTFKANKSASQVYYGSCGTNSVTIQAFASGTNQVHNITLFISLKDPQSGATTGWDAGEAMNPAGNGWFQRTVNVTSIPKYNTFANSWILYQFVATGSDGSIIGKSSVFSDIALSGCAAPPARIEPPRVAPVVTLTPKKIIAPPVIVVPTKTLIPGPK